MSERQTKAGNLANLLTYSLAHLQTCPLSTVLATGHNSVNRPQQLKCRIAVKSNKSFSFYYGSSAKFEEPHIAVNIMHMS